MDEEAPREAAGVVPIYTREGSGDGQTQTGGSREAVGPAARGSCVVVSWSSSPPHNQFLPEEKKGREAAKEI
jgi:hypothetical protein